MTKKQIVHGEPVLKVAVLTSKCECSHDFHDSSLVWVVFGGFLGCSLFLEANDSFVLVGFGLTLFIKTPLSLSQSISSQSMQGSIIHYKIHINLTLVVPS